MTLPTLRCRCETTDPDQFFALARIAPSWIEFVPEPSTAVSGATRLIGRPGITLGVSLSEEQAEEYDTGMMSAMMESLLQSNPTFGQRPGDGAVMCKMLLKCQRQAPAARAAPARKGSRSPIEVF
jgi:hypothetical protein